MHIIPVRDAPEEEIFGNIFLRFRYSFNYIL